MAKNYEKKSGPLVSVLLPTFNRPRYLPESLASALRQSYRNLQVIVINDGGEDVSDIVNSFGDPRLVFINRKQNRGKAFSLNEGLTRAEGKYIAYLDDDDLFFPNHIEALVDAMENKSDCQAAYSDLYKVCCKVMPDGSRQVLSKVVEISRDFDRFFMLYFNHVIHPSLMHRTDLLEKTGLYNENVKILIDWDMTRRLAFFTDFIHVYEITGQQYMPIGECDRISIQQRKDKSEYIKTLLAIRTTRPPKPWPKTKDMSIIFVTERLNQQAGKTVGLIWRHTFYPYKVYLPLPQADLKKLNTDMPNMVLVPVNALSSQTQKIDAALEKCEGEYITIVQSGFPVEEMWVEDPLYALINSSASLQGFKLEGSTDALWAAVVRKDDLKYARRSFPNLPILQSLKAVGIVLKHPTFEELPFQFDNLLKQAQLAEKDGNWAAAAQMFGYIAEYHHNTLWMKSLTARALFKAGDHTRAAAISNEVNRQRPTVNTLLLEAKVSREEKNFNSAINLLKRAEQILEGKELLWT